MYLATAIAAIASIVRKDNHRARLEDALTGPRHRDVFGNFVDVEKPTEGRNK